MAAESCELRATTSCGRRQPRRPATHVGLSWFIRDHAGHRTVYHAGGDTGFRAYVLLAPDDGIGIALASNWDETPRETLVEKTLDMLLASDGRRPRNEAAR